MNAEALPLRRRYIEAVWAYVAGGTETLRARGLELGRGAMEAGLGILDLALLQKEAASSLEPGPAQERAAEFFVEALAPYEMRLRGFLEANARLQALNAELERRVEERSRGLREKEAQLQEARKMEALGRLAGGVAHDFNNLLTVICGYIGLSLESGPPGADDEGLRRALRAADQAAALARQLLAFGRRQVNAPRTLDLEACARETLELLRRVVGEDISLEFKVDGGPCWSRADPGQLSQVLMNLLLNARDALPNGGRIEVGLGRERLDADRLEGHPDAKPGIFNRLSVSDNGTGMDAATRARVFEPFFTTKRPGQGTGLGLATVYAIVEQSDGLLSLSSAPGEGSTFTIHLPACDAPAHEPVRDDAPAPAAPREGRETLLLVEDDDQVRGYSRAVLSSAGYNVLAADRPSGALELMDAHGDEVAALVTDMVMPEMDGRRLYERLRERRPDLKALFLSGYQRDPAALEQNDRVDFLSKPFGPADLKERVRALLDRPGRRKDGGP